MNTFIQFVSVSRDGDKTAISIATYVIESFYPSKENIFRTIINVGESVYIADHPYEVFVKALQGLREDDNFINIIQISADERMLAQELKPSSDRDAALEKAFDVAGEKIN